MVLYHRYRGLCRLCHTDETEVYLMQERGTGERYWVCPICYGFHRSELVYAREATVRIKEKNLSKRVRRVSKRGLRKVVKNGDMHL